ncbi:45 kDa calcium-binding protein [Anopheles ziemanni]|uniref:45 kDa calcium-binding protein n=1 Tax=Anopheles coustani TaxID=139045 RepID=UPI00265AB60D|nr:45 kDa calcium-binding protein [Anopheles coustani]XP_058173571.1 45 kDa calcium-binding protein [Anopheles ziemanni]
MAKTAKFLRNAPRWSTLFPVLLYVLFILCILVLAFSSRESDPKHMKSDPLAKTDTKINVPSPLVYRRLEQSVVNELTAAFTKADTNGDKQLGVQELAKYINLKIREHIDNAIRTNPTMFVEIDHKPRDGLVSWDEYEGYWMREKGIQGDSHMKKSAFDKLDRKVKESIARDKALWMEAARTDPLSLTLDEFLSFRHPESSTVNLLNLVDDILRQFDVDGDDHLTVEEFSDVQTTDLGEGKKFILSQNVRERREEFTKVIDKNKDGRADRGELLSYVDPRHPRYAIQEATTLFSLADTNNDKKLTLNELFAKSAIFISSKMIHTAESFHDEF